MDPNKPISSDSAILFLSPSYSEVTINSPNPDQNHMDGHQILNQVQLQFIPTGNENAFVAGQIGPNESSIAIDNEPTIIATGIMKNERDTDFLVDDTQPIDLGSPVRTPGAVSGSKLTIWQFDYYGRYFDLTSDVFFRRIIWSLLPLTGGEKGTYIDCYIQSNPDLYGPFWIPLTLVFVISICNDIIRYFNSLNPTIPNTSPPNTNHSMNNTIRYEQFDIPYHPLTFEFSRINIVTTITLSYVIIAPLILWSFCKWRHCAKLYTFIECLCAYGYSLSLFIPVTLLALVNIHQIQFILFASAAFLSGSVLLISFAPVVNSDPSRSFKFAYIMLIFILVAHLILALFYLYLFL